MKTKKILTLALACVMALALAVPAFATDTATATNSSATSTVTAQVAANTTFSVTVPTDITVTVAANGVVTTPTNLYIANASTGPVKVTGITATARTGWTLATYSGNYSSVPVGTKQLGMTIAASSGGTARDISSTDALASLATDIGVIAGGSQSGVFAFQANIPAQANTVNEVAADIVFTVAWNAVT